MSLLEGFGAAARMAFRPVERWLHDARFVAALEAAEKGKETKLEIAREALTLSAAMDDLASRLK